MELTEEQIFLNIFPEEVWEQILHHVDPHQKLSFLHTSTFFRRLLLPFRQSFLFCNVWQLLLDRKIRILERPGEQELDHIVALNLRLVCVDWCQVINKFFENRANHGRQFRGLKMHDTGTSKPFSHWTTLDLSDVSHCVSSVNTLLENLRNFPVNRLSLKISSVHLDLQMDQEKVTKALEFLQIYGEHIWHMELTLSAYNRDSLFSDYIQYYTVFRQLLTFVPNLKLFKWVGDSLEFLKHEEPLLQLLEKEQIRKLEHLRGLHFHNVPSSIANHFVQANNQVNYINFYQCPLDFSQIFVPNLKRLMTGISSEQEFRNLELHSDVSWQLQEISLNFNKDLPYICWSRVFALLETFKATLETVSLWLPAISEYKDFPNWIKACKMRLNLPNVKHLQLQIWKPCGLDFILPMKQSLEQLICKYDYLECRRERQGFFYYSKVQHAPERYNHRINFNWAATNLTDVFDSDIWELFPKLNKVYLQVKIFHRPKM